MPSCHEMREGEVYVCKDCGLELKVVKECRDATEGSLRCSCEESESPCTFSCCGEEMVKKE